MPVQYIPHPIRAIITNPVRAINPGGVADFTFVYQNANLRPIMCVISVICQSGGVHGIGGSCRAIGSTAINPAPVGNYVYFGWQQAPGANEWISGNIVLMVPPGYYYRVFADTGAGQVVGLHLWVEIEL